MDANREKLAIFIRQVVANMQNDPVLAKIFMDLANAYDNCIKGMDTNLSWGKEFIGRSARQPAI
jgi:hypothetical protein